MATINVGYNAAGTALDYTTYAAAETAATAGDRIELHYVDAYQGLNWAGITIAKNITLAGAFPRQRVALAKAVDYGITATSSFTVENLRFYGSSSGIFMNGAFTVVIDRCIFDGAGLAVLLYGTSTVTITSCLAVDCYSLIYCVAATAVTCNNCTAYNCANAYVDSGAMALLCNNCIAINCAFDWYNIPVMVKFAGMRTARGDDYIDLKANDAHFWGAEYDFCDGNNFRIKTDSCLFGTGVAVEGVTHDLLNRPYNETPSRGCYEGGNASEAEILESGASPVAEAAAITPNSADPDVILDGETVVVDGETINGTAIEETHEQAEAPTVFTLTSSSDGLTHTVNVTGPTGAAYVIHDTAHTVEFAAVDGEKIRGIVGGTTYHCHAVK